MPASFIDRRQAGLELSARLKQYEDNAVLLALPRGGVEVAVEIAGELEMPLNLAIARKIGHPGNPEYAIGAVTENGPAIWNEIEYDNLDEVWLKKAEREERTEAKRRRLKYLAGRSPALITGHTAILVDDGIATGFTIEAAIADIRIQKPGKIVVAVPVAPRDIFEDLVDQVDEVIVLVNPDQFAGAVGYHYEDFPQLSDDDVLTFLEEADQ